jgi:ATP-dependent helicase/nuclease subunit A
MDKLMTVSQINNAQKIAADPKNSCWVEASAGSGKTKVLTDRVLNLLLHGTDPEKILCLTFTKAAAAEMGNRLRSRLSNWAVMKDADLLKDLENLIEENPKNYVKHARMLFTKFVDTPGGLKFKLFILFAIVCLKNFL